MSKRVFSAWVVCFAAVLLLPIAASAQTPPFKVLRKSNVSLEMKGFTFASGLNPDSNGNANGQGAEMIGIEWAGSGFIVDKDGTLITNYHVARRALQAEAVFDDGGIYKINAIRVYDPVNDLAALQIAGGGEFPSVRLGDSDNVEVMDEVIAVGNSLDLGLAVTKGDVNQLIRDETTRGLVRIRHSAAIAPGNSGGALYKGSEVVGVNVATRPPYEIHYAIPINIAKTLLTPEYEEPIPLAQVFPPDVDSILNKAQHVWSTNGQIDAVSEEQPGVYSVQFELYPLEDYCLYLQSPGADLSLGIVDSEGNWYGWSNYEGEEEVLLLANDYYMPVTIAVFNYGDAPADFGLGVYNITW